MVLQLALFVELLARRAGEYLPSSSLERLGAATRWLLAHFDSISGRAANLGHNDGANPLPLAMAEYADYRPLIQAASLVFLGRPALPAGAWDEYVQWLGLTAGAPVTKSRVNIPWRIERLNEWASLRGRRYASRPRTRINCMWISGIKAAIFCWTQAHTLITLRRPGTMG